MIIPLLLFFIILIRNKLYIPAIIFFMFGSYALIIKLAANSRWAAVMIFVMLPFLSNVLAGAKDLSLAIQKGPLFYPENYKILSFSPLISAIDGYDSIRKLYQHKITSYMPFNFYAELYFFGWKYWALAFLIFTLGLRILNRATLKYRLMGYLLSTPGLFCFLMMQQYAIRTCFRYFVISILLILIFDHYQKRKLMHTSFASNESNNEQLKKIKNNAS